MANSWNAVGFPRAPPHLHFLQSLGRSLKKCLVPFRFLLHELYAKHLYNLILNAGFPVTASQQPEIIESNRRQWQPACKIGWTGEQKQVKRRSPNKFMYKLSSYRRDKVQGRKLRNQFYSLATKMWVYRQTTSCVELWAKRRNLNHPTLRPAIWHRI